MQQDLQQDLQIRGAGSTALEGEGPVSAEKTAGAAESPGSLQEPALPERQAWQTDHAINLRLTIPLPFLRCYLTIVGGRERRNKRRLAADRRKNPLTTIWNLSFLILLGLVTGLALFTVMQFVARLMIEQAGMV